MRHAPLRWLSASMGCTLGVGLAIAFLTRAKLVDAGPWTFEQPFGATHGYNTASVCVIPTGCGHWPHLDVIEATLAQIALKPQ
jgi:hypothetical protein